MSICHRSAHHFPPLVQEKYLLGVSLQGRQRIQKIKVKYQLLAKSQIGCGVIERGVETAWWEMGLACLPSLNEAKHESKPEIREKPRGDKRKARPYAGLDGPSSP